MAVGDLGQDVDEVGLGIDVDELAALDERGDGRAQVSAPLSEPAKSAFLRVSAIGRMERSTMFGIDLDPPVFEEAAKAVPARQRVADRLGEPGLLADQEELAAQPRLEGIEERLGFFHPDVAARVGILAADLGLDAVEFGDARERFGTGLRVRRLRR